MDRPFDRSACTQAHDEVIPAVFRMPAGGFIQPIGFGKAVEGDLVTAGIGDTEEVR